MTLPARLLLRYNSEMDEQQIPRRQILDILFGVVQAGYITTVISSAVVWMCAFMAHTPFKGYPGSRVYREVSPILMGLMICMFLFGAFWVEFSRRANSSVWIRRCVYFAFGFLVFAAFGSVMSP